MITRRQARRFTKCVEELCRVLEERNAARPQVITPEYIASATMAAYRALELSPGGMGRGAIMRKLWRRIVTVPVMPDRYIEPSCFALFHAAKATRDPELAQLCLAIAQYRGRVIAKLVPTLQRIANAGLPA